MSCRIETWSEHSDHSCLSRHVDWRIALRLLRPTRRTSRMWCGLVCIVALIISSPAAAANRYWVAAGPGDSNNTANWSTSSGGAGGASIPGSADTAIFDGGGLGDVTISIAPTVAAIDIQAGYTGTVTQGVGVPVTVTGTFSQAGGAFMGSASSISIGSTFTVSGGTFTSTSGTLTLGWDFIVSTGTFNANNGTVNHIGRNINIGATALNALTINTSQTVGVTGAVTVNGTLTFTALYDLDYGTLAAYGDVITTLSANGGSGNAPGNLLITGTNNQIISAAGGTGRVPAVVINKTGGTVTFQDTIAIFDGDSSSLGWTYTAGTIDTSASTISFVGCSQTITSVGMSFNNVTINNASCNFNVSNTLTILGNLTISSASYLNNFSAPGEIQVAGNVTTTAQANENGAPATIVFNGTGAQTFSAAGGTGGVSNVKVAKASGVLTIQDTISINGNAWTWTSGNVSASGSTIVFENACSKAVNSGTMIFGSVKLNLAGGCTFSLTNTMTVGENLSITSNHIINSDTGTIDVSGNLSSTATAVSGTGSIQLVGTGNQSISTSGTGDLPNGAFILNKTGGLVQLASSFVLNGAGQDFLIYHSTLDINGFNLTVPDILNLDGTTIFRLQGAETISYTTLTLHAQSIFEYNGAGTYTSLKFGNSYSNNLSFNGTGNWTHTGALSVTGNLTITTGTLISNGQNVTVTGNWSNTGTYTSGTNTVTLNGTNQSITGNTTFSSLTKSVATAATLTFAAGSSTIVTGTATLNGAAGQLLSLRSSIAGTRWIFRLNSGAAKSISYVDVQDSDASPTAAALKIINPPNSNDSLNNLSWFPISLSGKVYSDAGVTPLAGATVHLIANGSSNGTPNSTAGDGSYTINDAAINPGDAVLLYIDGNGTYHGNTVTIVSGLPQTGLDIYNSHLITREDNGGSIRNDQLGSAVGSYSDPTDILYTVTTSNLTVSGTNWTLYIPSGQSYRPQGNVTTPNMTSAGIFNGDTHNINVNNSFNLSSGTFTSTSGTFYVRSTLNISGGTFTHNSGTVQIDNGATSASSSITPGGATFYNVYINKGGAWGIIVTGIWNIAGTLTISNGTGDINGTTINLQGDLVVNGIEGRTGTATIVMNGGGTQTVSGPGAGGDISKFEVLKTTGTLIFTGTLVFTLQFTYVQGATITTGSTIVIGDEGASATTNIDAAGINFYNLTFDKGLGGWGIVVVGNLTIENQLSFIGGSYSVTGNTAYVGGNLSSTTSGAISGTLLIELNGTGSQSINTPDLPNGTMVINKSAGAASLGADLVLQGAGSNLSVTAGTLDIAGYNLTVPATLSVSSGATLHVRGSETISYTTLSLNNGSTVVYNGFGIYPSLVLGNSYHHLTFNGSGTWTTNAALSVGGNINILQGTLDSAGNNITVGGDWYRSATSNYTSGTNTVTFNGSNHLITGDNTFNNFTKIATVANTLTFQAGKTQTINGTLTLQGASAANRLSLVSDTPGVQWQINPSGVRVITAVAVQDSNNINAVVIDVINTNSIDNSNNTNWKFLPTLDLVIQVWNTAGSACIASSPADSNCGSTTIGRVLAGSTVNLLIFVRNIFAVSATDIRFKSNIDTAGFTYIAGSLLATDIASLPLDTATLTTIYNAATLVQTDASDTDMVSINTAASPNVLSIGAPLNATVSIPANQTFAVKFSAIKK